MNSVTRRRVKLESPKDLLFFVNSDTVPVLIGTIGLAFLELGELPADSPFSWFVNDYKLAIVLVLVGLAVLPPPIARGMAHLRDRDDAARKTAENATAFRALGSRASNFVLKLREAFAGQSSNTYQHHLLNECKAYFESRPMKGASERPDNVRVEAAFYGARVTGQARLLERKLYTNAEPSRMRTNFSSRGAANGEGRSTIERIWGGGYVFCGDVADPDLAAAHHIHNGDERPYRTFLSVPVFRDRKALGDGRILGMLSVNVSHTGVVHESDHNILEVYAWFLAAALEADHFGNKLRMLGVSVSSSS